MKKIVMKTLSYILVALLASTLTMGLTVAEKADQTSKLEQLESLIDQVFIGEADHTAMQDAAAGAMVEALGDRWSYYMSAEDYLNYKDQMANSYVGIGITVQLRQDGTGIDVTQVTAGGPAEEAGILPGDVIVAVEGQSIAGQTLNEVSGKIKGKENSYVQLTVIRGQDTVEVRVQRRKIETPVATGVMLDGNIGLVKIVNFDSRCAQETQAAVNDLLKQGAEKLIFDVRYNPGGYKKELVEILNYLLPEGLLFRSEYYDGTVTDDQSDERCLRMPMAVLVNGSSYSAAEFFAAALRDYDWATVVGTQTCGKGYFQNTYALKDGSAVAISVGKYFTPKGVSLAEVGGLTPDVVVEVDDKTAAAIYAGTIDPMKDPQILAAIDAMK